jgi:eukaryotic-like serine/threonine-protein kinase
VTLAPGTRFGPYEISAQIGAGGIGEVYRARDTKLERQVAIKVFECPGSGSLVQPSPSSR